MGTSRKRLRKCSRKVHTDKVQEDGPFSWLPDEIIVSHILPRLTLQEAVRCSVLSRRWEKLWTQIIGPKLLFSRSFNDESNKVYVNNCLMWKLAPNFADWITRVLKTYSKPTLEELIVRYGFDSSNSESLDGWVEFALRKGVTRLELDLSPRAYCKDPKQYAFPSVIKTLSGGFFCNLRDVCLKHVVVPVEVFQFMLSKCPLERLCLWNSRGLGSVKVPKKALNLKILEFVRCHGLQIDISASNLVSLKYVGLANYLKTKPLPHLLELSLGASFCNLFLRTGAKNFQSISQLRRLSLDLDRELHRETFRYPLEYPAFVNLEQLELTMIWDEEGNISPLWPILLIKAAPRLRSFSVIKVRMLWTSVEQQDWSDIRNATKLVKHPSLEVIELHQYTALPCQLELGRALLDVSPSLKRFMLVPLPCPYDPFRGVAQEFRRWIPNGVNFVVR